MERFAQKLAVFCETPMRASRSGRGGRRFKSCHSDQYLGDFRHPFRTDIRTETGWTPSPAKGVNSLVYIDHKSLVPLVFLLLDQQHNYAPSPILPQTGVT